MAAFPARFCDMCGQSFLTKHHNKKRCSPACVKAYKAQWAQIKNAVNPERRLGILMHCARCGISLTRTGAMQKHCRPCQNLVNKEVFRRSKGAAAWDVFGTAFFCVVCGTEALRTGPRQKYCSKPCYDIANAQKMRDKHGSPRTRGKPFTCLACGKAGVHSGHSRETYCSQRCMKSYNKALRLRKHFGEGGIPYTRRQIFERDHWHCQACWKHVRDNVPLLHPSRSTIDHIIPLTKGGKDCESNVHTLCWPCNRQKNARVGKNDQLRLALNIPIDQAS